MEHPPRGTALQLALFAAAVVVLALAPAPLRAQTAQPAAAPPSPAPQHLVRLVPQYSPGDTLHYQIALRSQTRNRVGGAMANPEGAADLGLSVSLLLRLDVLPPLPSGDAGPGAGAGSPGKTKGSKPVRRDTPLRLRATYERATATLSGDAYDPNVAKVEEEYRKLEGRSMEFQIGTDGHVQYMEGLSDILHDARAVNAVRKWLEQLSGGLGAPPAGAEPGRSWHSTEPLPDAPLAGTAIETQTTYLRNESCDVDDPAADKCAILLSHFSLRQKPGQFDPTPDSFRKQNLSTSGHWDSQGQSLLYISLRTGRTVSITQSGEETMELTISHNDGGPPFHYSAQAKTETRILLLTEGSAAP
jgi:hypothetical protein